MSVGDDHRIITVLDVVLIEFLVLFALRIFHHGAFVGKAVDASAPTAMDECGILCGEFQGALDERRSVAVGAYEVVGHQSFARERCRGKLTHDKAGDKLRHTVGFVSCREILARPLARGVHIVHITHTSRETDGAEHTAVGS